MEFMERHIHRAQLLTALVIPPGRVVMFMKKSSINIYIYVYKILKMSRLKGSIDFEI